MTDTKCFAHDHMTCAEYGLWTLGRELSHKTGVLYFDGRNMAARFRRGGKTAMYDHMHALIASGWFVVLEPRKRKANGQWSAHALRILSHDEWAAAHPDAARKTCKSDAEPVRFSDSACPVSASQPVRQGGHSIGKDLQSDKNPQYGDSLVKSTCPQNRNGELACAEVPTCPNESKTEPLEQRVRAASPVIGTGPVPEPGQVRSDSVTSENPVVAPPVPKRRRSLQELTKLATTTNTTVDALLSGGTFELTT